MESNHFSRRSSQRRLKSAQSNAIPEEGRVSKQQIESLKQKEERQALYMTKFDSFGPKNSFTGLRHSPNPTMSSPSATPFQYHNYLVASLTADPKETHLTGESNSDHDESICDSLKLEPKTSGRVEEFRSFSVL